MLSFFFHFYANGQPNVTYGIHYYITTEFDYAKHDSGLVLQRFEFIKVFYENATALLEKSIILIFCE